MKYQSIYPLSWEEHPHPTVAIPAPETIRAAMAKFQAETTHVKVTDIEVSVQRTTVPTAEFGDSNLWAIVVTGTIQ